MSIIDDYAAIGKALRDITEPPAHKVDLDELIPPPEPAPQQAPWALGQQAAQNPYQQALRSQGCGLCEDAGWIAVLRGGRRWIGLPCIHCRNPQHKANPLP